MLQTGFCHLFVIKFAFQKLRLLQHIEGFLHYKNVVIPLITPASVGVFYFPTWHLIFMSFFKPIFLPGFFIANLGYLQYG